MINRNMLAAWIAGKEGKKVQVNIAQIKEVLRWTLLGLADNTDAEILTLIAKVRREKTRNQAKKQRRAI
jgi:hypothetical protein